MPQCLKCGTELPVNEEGVAPVLCDRCAGVATSRARRGMSTGTMRDYPITTVLMAINLTVFAGMLMTGGFGSHNSFRWGANFGPLTLGGQYWRLVTANFVHGGFLHIAFNMWCLWSLGQLTERLFGRWQTFVIYVLTGVGGSMLSIAYDPQRWEVGASGAIFGLAGALLSGLKFGNLAVSEWQRRSAISSMVTFIVINFALGGFGNTDNMCHLGGFFTGLIIGLPLSATHRKNKSLQIAMLLLTAFLLAAGANELVRTHGQFGRLFTAEYALDRGDSASAIDALQREITAHPDDADAYALLGDAYRVNHNSAGAVAAYRKALQLNPNLSYAQESLDELLPEGSNPR
ncbi:MAG TPA: rhomboid family intramembrane serine protease [Candidatus Angelobacter sp.]|nr:rhomboid family intramembrane serine protease [Candidatus Angelobacter sp.]